MQFNANDTHSIILSDDSTFTLFNINLDITNIMRQLLLNLYCIMQIVVKGLSIGDYDCFIICHCAIEKMD